LIPRYVGWDQRGRPKLKGGLTLLKIKGSDPLKILLKSGSDPTDSVSPTAAR